MFDSDIMTGMRGALANLHRHITLIVDSPVADSDNCNMLEAVEEIASCNPNISIERESVPAGSHAAVRIVSDNGNNNITFEAVPRGNMLSAFLHAILNAGGVGFTLPTPLLRRVERIGKDLTLVSYVGEHSPRTPRSLQVINEIVASNPRLHHLVIDARMERDTLHRYGIEKVPAVTIDNALISESWESPADVVATLTRLSA